LYSPTIASRSVSFSETDSPIETQYLLRLEPRKPVSAWSRSLFKRIFDISCVLMAAPLVLPVCLFVGVGVRLTSRGPVLFKQRRSGLHGVSFTIFKFRTMEHEAVHKAEATVNQSFTSIGPFLRRWKLDELPQLLNVLLGDMSLVGPRPKVAEQQLGDPICRPGITGAATLVFAYEEAVLTRIPRDLLCEYIRNTVLPAKLELDREYMAEATFLSDLSLIVRTLVRRWDGNTIFRLQGIEHPQSAEMYEGVAQSRGFDFATEESASGN
jgi:lipopolysaccharide/colanic/teichoic acid biosynthesis glycosyltransferase